MSCRIRTPAVGKLLGNSAGEPGAWRLRLHERNLPAPSSCDAPARSPRVPETGISRLRNYAIL